MKKNKNCCFCILPRKRILFLRRINLMRIETNNTRQQSAYRLHSRSRRYRSASLLHGFVKPKMERLAPFNNTALLFTHPDRLEPTKIFQTQFQKPPLGTFYQTDDVGRRFFMSTSVCLFSSAPKKLYKLSSDCLQFVYLTLYLDKKRRI